MEQKVIVIVGPTCSGKTDLSLELSKKLNTEIISADSRQIYKYLTIGTAKPTSEELSLVPHYLIDTHKPDIVFNASKFEKESLKIISKLHSENKIPIVVGGSGLYIKALIDGIFDEVESDPIYRDELLVIRKEKGNDYLYDLLKKVDPNFAETVLPQNWKRVMRALEVYKTTGKSILEFHKNQKREINLDFFQFGLSWEREILYNNIEARVDQMIEAGLVEEVKQILKLGYSKNLNSLNTVGYKEIISFLNMEISLSRATELIKRNTRRYAKRQMTWFRKDDRIKWFDIKSKNDINKISDQIIKNIS